MNIKYISLILILLSEVLFSSAQTKPFPQKGKFSYMAGFQTDVISNDQLLAFYDAWKKNYTESCSTTGGIRVLSDQWSGNNRFTVSEGQAYGMIMAAYFGDKEFFDKLLVVYNFPAFQTRNKLMHWRVLCDVVDGSWCATDADQDAALALLVAYEQWGDVSYKNRALEVIKAMREHVLYPINYDSEIKWQMRIGDNDTNPPTNAGVITDYYSPAYYRVYAEYEGNKQIWDEHRVSGQAYLKRNVDRLGPTTGINSKIAYPDGSATPGQCAKTGQWGNPCTYNWDASRTPWRQALDYAWYGEAGVSSRDYCNKLTDWVDNTLGVNNINSAGYWPDGTEEYPGTGPKIAFVGGFACGAMCHSQDRLDRFATKALSTNEQSYYGNSLRILYYLLITGNMWKPGEKVTSSVIFDSKEKDNKIKIYPNPVNEKEQLNIEFEWPVNTPVDIKITNLSGQAILYMSEETGYAKKLFSVDTSGFQGGMYIISVSSKYFKNIEKVYIN